MEPAPKKRKYVKQVFEPRDCDDPTCKIEFIPIRKWQKFCCDNHRVRTWIRNKKAGDKA